MKQAVLALDQGSHASRACLFDEAGQLMALASVDVATHSAREAFVEQNPEELVESLRTAADHCLAKAPAVSVVAAGLATQRSSIVCCERQSQQPLSAVLSWQDRRNAEWLSTLAPHAERVRAITGLPLSPHYGASKMRWCLDHSPAVAAASQLDDLLIAPLASFLAAALTDSVPLADPANASRTLLYDTARLDWSEELLSLFGVQRAELPKCSSTVGDFGQMRCGTRAFPLRAVSGDQSVVPFAIGPVDERTAFVNLGTGAFIQRPLLSRPSNVAPLLGSVLSAESSQAIYSVEGTVNGAGSALSWFLQQSGADEASLWQQLEELSESDALPLFQNGIGGLGSPWWHSSMPARFIGKGDDLHRFASVLESIVFMLAANFQLMSARTPALEQVFVSGGMSRSPWLCRRLAAALGVPVLRMLAEATCRGIAALAAPELAARWQRPAVDRFEPGPMTGVQKRQRAFMKMISDAVRAPA